LWAGLCELERAFRKLRTRTEELIGTPEGVSQIQQVGSGILKLLPEGENNDNEH